MNYEKVGKSATCVANLVDHFRCLWGDFLSFNFGSLRPRFVSIEARPQRSKFVAKISLPLVFQALALGLMLFSSASVAAPPTGVGQRVVTNDGVNVRSSAAGTAIGSQPAGSYGTTTAGPVAATLNGTLYNWFSVNFDSGTDGWVASIGLDLVASTVDVQPLNVSRGSSSVVAGGSLGVSWQIRNNGTGTASSSYSQVRITTSNSSYGSPSDNVGSPQATGLIGPGSTINQSTTVTVPTTPGTYYVWVIADNTSVLTQTNTANDFAVSASFTVTAATTVDVQPLNVSRGSSSVVAGGSLGVSWQIRNNGTGTASSSYSQVRITTSNSSYGSPSDNVGSPQATGLIGPGSTINQSTTVTVPTTPGTYYVWVIADNTSVLTQTNTANDFAVSASFAITAATPSISQVSPTSMPGSNSEQTLTIDGSNFASEATLTFDPPTGGNINSTESKFTSKTNSRLVYSINNANDIGTWLVRVNNPGGQSSGWASFTVTADSIPGSFALSNDPPFWDSRDPAGPAVQLHWTASAQATNYEVFREGLKIYPPDGVNFSGTAFLNEIGLLPGQTYTYHIVALNSVGSRQSNSIEVGPMPYDSPAPVITGISPPSMPASTQEQLITVLGENFTPGVDGGGMLVFRDPDGGVYYTTSHPQRIESVTDSEWAYWTINDGHMGTWTVQVVNADGKTSNQATFQVGPAEAGLSIQGSVSLNGNALQGVSVALSGAATTQTTSGASGAFVFAGLGDGSYTVTPSNGSYQFDPASTAVVLAGANRNYVNFRACNSSQPLVVLLRDPNGQPLTGGDVSVGGNVAVEGPTGSYVISGLGCSSGTVSATVLGQTRDEGFDRFANSTKTITFNPESAVSGVPPNSELHGDPVNTATGNYVYQRRDLDIPSIGMPLRFERTYNSREANLPGAASAPLGYGWTHTFNVSLEDVASLLTVTWGDGHTETYSPDGEGGFTAPFGNWNVLSDEGGGIFSLTTRDRRVHLFDTTGRLSSIVDKNGNSFSLGYTGNDLTEIVDTAGRITTLTYDPDNRIVSIVDPIGRSIEYDYDVAGDLVAATDPNGNVTQYTYNGEHQILTVIDPRGHTVVDNEYDPVSYEVISQLDAKGNATQYDYQKDLGITTITDALGNVAVHYHDSYLRLVKRVDARGGIELFEYDEEGNRISVTDKNGNVTQYGYDAYGNVVSKTDALGNVTTISYDAFDNPVSRTDALGNLTQFEYDANDNLIRTTDALGNVTEFTYLANGLLQTTLDPRGFITTNSYSAHGDLALVTDPLGQTTAYTHDDAGRMLSQTDALGRVTTHSYDDDNNLLSVTDPDGHVIQHTYDANNNRTSTTDRNGNTTQWEYDPKDLVTREIDPQAHEEAYTYDALDRRISLTDRRGFVTQFEYDEVGNLTEVTDSLGNFTTHSYDLNGNRLSSQNARNFTTHFAYDALNRRIQSRDPLNNEVSTEFDALGRPISVDAPGGRTTHNSYDALGRLVQVEDPAGGITQFSHDATGNRVSTTDPEGNVTLFAFDQLNRLEQITDALGHSSQIGYDAVGNREWESDALGHTTISSYDNLDRLVGKTDALGNTIVTAYDPGGRITSVTDANGKVTSFEYDANDRLTKVTDAAAGTVTYTYDENGNRLSVVDPNGHTMQFSYDALNRRTSMTEALAHVTQFAYDEVGNLTQKTTPHGQIISFSYDARDLRAGIDYAAQPDVTFVYDAASRLESIADGLGTTTYAYDLLDRRISTTDPFGNVVAYAYDASGNRTTLTYPGSKAVDFNYDAANRLVTVTDWLGNVTQYGYDNANRLTDTLNANGTTTSYAYDDANRLVALSNAMPDTSIINSYAYVLDPVGNHQSEDRNEPLAPVFVSGVTDDTHDAENRLIDSNGVGNSFDSDGTMITKGTGSYEYDAAERLIETNIGGIQTQYQYDGLGSRYARIRDGVTTRFVLDTNTSLTRVLMETDDAGVPVAYNVYGHGLISRVLADESVLQYHYDSRGSTVAITDSAESTVREFAYDPFGQVVNTTGTESTPFKFLGQHGVLDEGEELNYIRARYYDSELQRFISKDPWLGDDSKNQTKNRYTYGLNNPVRMLDLSGYSALESTSAFGNLAWPSNAGENLIIIINSNVAGSTIPLLLRESCESAWWNLRNNGCYSGPGWSMGIESSAPSGLTPRQIADIYKSIPPADIWDAGPFFHDFAYSDTYASSLSDREQNLNLLGADLALLSYWQSIGFDEANFKGLFHYAVIQGQSILRYERETAILFNEKSIELGVNTADFILDSAVGATQATWDFWSTSAVGATRATWDFWTSPFRD